MSTVSWADLTRIFGRIGLLSFGGPAAQIALMQTELVARRKWLTEAQFQRALSLCMLLPGPEAMQLATYAGWRLRDAAGGLLAGLLFVVPGALVITALAALYLSYGDLPALHAAFTGIKAAVIAIVIQALIRVASKALTGPVAWALAVFAFVALFALALPYPLVIAAAAAVGALTATGSATTSAPHHVQPRFPQTALLWGALWAAPLVLAWALDADFLLELGLFFSKLAVVTFGGAYAVLAYMTQEVVQHFGWIDTGAMIDALGLAETTPGPLILVTEFVAILAGHAQSGTLVALLAGLMALWVTFTPCFLWIFVAGPFLDLIADRPRIEAALHGITAAIVGVIASLSLWFALHVLFPAAPQRPNLTVLDLPALSLVLGGLALTLLLRRSMPQTLALLAGAALILWTIGLNPA